MAVLSSGLDVDPKAGYLVVVEYAGDLPTNQPLASRDHHVGGFIGSSGWLGVGAVEKSLRIVHYEDGDSAREQLRERVESTDAPPAVQDIPPTIHHLTVQGHRGRSLERAEVGSYLTSIRIVAAPGYGDAAAQQVEDALGSFELIEGYAGQIQGFNVALPDEIWAFVLWNSPPLLPPPPADEEATIEHYRRVV